MILMNSLLIGVSTDYLATEEGASEKLWMVLCGYACSLFFLLELLVRITAHRKNFFCNKQDILWNSFDVILVVFSFIDFILEQTVEKGRASVGSAMKTVKMLR